MNIETLGVAQSDAALFLKEYKAHRDVYDKRDWEIERIYRAIAKGKTVISVQDAIRNAGVDSECRPRLAICEAHAQRCICTQSGDDIVFGIDDEAQWGPGVGRIRIRWPGAKWFRRCIAILPRIPPQHRPASNVLSSYHILWEADWQELPRDPYLLRRIGKDAWVVLAAWELTDVELSVLRARATA